MIYVKFAGLNKIEIRNIKYLYLGYIYYDWRSNDFIFFASNIGIRENEMTIIIKYMKGLKK